MFRQVLEGVREEVHELYSNVLQDDRHIDVTLLDYAEIAERRFSIWSMGRIDLDRVNTDICSNTRNALPPVVHIETQGRAAHQLLEQLADTAWIVACV